MLPVAAFVAAVYGTNRLMTESELVVLQATGFSPYRLALAGALLRADRGAADVCAGHVLVLGQPGAPERARNDEIAQNVTARILRKASSFIQPPA